MSRVFVVQEPLKKGDEGKVKPRIDLSPAAEFGELVMLLNWADVRKLSRDELVWKLRRGLKSFDASDYLLMVGSPSAMWAAGAIASEMTGGRVKTLEWDNINHRYDVVVTDLNCQPL